MNEHHQIADRLAEQSNVEITARFAKLRDWNNRAVGQYLRRVRERMDGARCVCECGLPVESGELGCWSCGRGIAA